MSDGRGCPECGTKVARKEFQEHLKACPNCGVELFVMWTCSLMGEWCWTRDGEALGQLAE